MSGDRAGHYRAFAELLDVWNTAVASAMSFGLTEEQAVKAVGEWLDVSLAVQRSDQRLAALDVRGTVAG